MRRIIKSTVKKFWAALTLLSLELIIVLVIFICATALFAFLVNNVFFQRKEGFDFRVFDFLSQYVNDTNTYLMTAVTFLGTHTFLIPANIALILYFLFIKKHRWYSIKVPAVALSSLLLMSGLKILFSRPRPTEQILRAVSGFSFPSGHAMTSFTFYGLLIYIIYQSVPNKPLKWTLITLLVLLILTIGFSRVYLRVHYASDVLAGFAMGLIWLVLSVSVIRRIEKYTRKKIDPAVQTNTLVVE